MQPQPPSSQALHPEGSQPRRPSLGGCVGSRAGSRHPEGVISALCTHGPTGPSSATRRDTGGNAGPAWRAWVRETGRQSAGPGGRVTQVTWWLAEGTGQADPGQVGRGRVRHLNATLRPSVQAQGLRAGGEARPGPDETHGDRLLWADNTALPAAPPRSAAGRTVTSKCLIATESDTCNQSGGSGGRGPGACRDHGTGSGGHSHSRARGAGIRSMGETVNRRQERLTPHTRSRGLVETPGTPLPWHLPGALSGLEGSPGHQGVTARSQPPAQTRPQVLFRGTQREVA